MIPIMIYICKKCKKAENVEIVIKDYDVEDESWKMKGKFCPRCWTFYITSGEMDIKHFKVDNVANVKWPVEGEKN